MFSNNQINPKCRMTKFRTHLLKDQIFSHSEFAVTSVNNCGHTANEDLVFAICCHICGNVHILVALGTCFSLLGLSFTLRNNVKQNEGFYQM